VAKRKLTEQDAEDLTRITRVLCIPQAAADEVRAVPGPVPTLAPAAGAVPVRAARLSAGTQIQDPH
jgi:hypothetical protein